MFVLIFEYKFQPNDIETILSEFVEEFKPGDQQEYIERVVRGAVEKIDQIDSVIDGVSNDWKVERISCVSIAVLRLAVYEIMFCEDIPSAVSINEAVRLAKKYEGDETAPFINGVLGKISEM